MTASTLPAEVERLAADRDRELRRKLWLFRSVGLLGATAVAGLYGILWGLGVIAMVHFVLTLYKRHSRAWTRTLVDAVSKRTAPQEVEAGQS
jgi:hypothetical protein